MLNVWVEPQHFQINIEIVIMNKQQQQQPKRNNNTEQTNVIQDETQPIDEEDDYEDEEDDDDAILANPAVTHLRKYYSIYPPAESEEAVLKRKKYNVEHHRVHLEFSRSSAHGEGGKKMIEPTIPDLLVFPNAEKLPPRIQVIAIGVVSWSCEGTTSVGISLKDFPKDIWMGSKKFMFTMFPRGVESGVHRLVFQTKNQNSINKDFPHWSPDDWKLGWVKSEYKGRFTYFLSTEQRQGQVVCPLGYFKKKSMEAANLKPNIVSGMVGGQKSFGINVDEDDYKEVVDDFIACVRDSRVTVDPREMKLDVAMKDTIFGTYHSHLILDVYYSI
jgi:hypothetical protein